ncbi:DUF2306 domain-containing protein [Microbispora corallina]|uniref:DUF2306 domain-containing protein n=1 Tax=Microbispora corallina TaxID=83302 RepID=A0ABQ4FYV3_9ACTN|nr:DUF2306 domain-containing protein [Microbispora corallina]GIH39980.1 hypothetical protein Mco01_29800 [Microbispora corallina]
MTQDVETAGVQATWTHEPPQRTRGRAAAPRERVPWWRGAWAVAFAVLVVFNLIWALPTYLTFDPALSRIPLSPNFPGHLHYPTVVIHAITGNVTMVTGFLQLLPWLRRRSVRFHRVSGWLYVFAGALPAALLGLALLPFSQAPTGRVGLFGMAVAWIVTTVQGYRMQRAHRYAEHRRWMYYSFALALGTSWGRVVVIFMGITGVQFDMMLFLEAISWGWVLNVLVAKWLVERRRRRPARAAA